MSKKRWKTWQPLPHLEVWRSELAKRMGAAQADQFLEGVQDRYAHLYAGRIRYEDAALREHLEENILPGLALYQALLEAGQRPSQALDLVQQLFYAALRKRRKQLKFLGRLPFFFTLLRIVTRPFTNRNFPPKGWQIEWLDLNHKVVGFDMHSCFYLDMLDAYGVPELAAVFCNLDDLLYEDLSPYMRWERTKTLARGDDCCDFRFHRARPAPEPHPESTKPDEPDTTSREKRKAD
ncbi:MAG: L-2-amino-thiazoline-4-carboxylic acid hydrolase [Anaerolineae bacterium]|jgi:hypothetical protein